MKRFRVMGVVLLVFSSLIGGLATSAFAESPAGMKLYSFSSGALTNTRLGFFQNLGDMTKPLSIPVGFFVISHPMGNVVFDTGNNDKIIEDPSYWGPLFDGYKPVNTPDVAIDVQLKKIGMVPDDIKYVVISHMHLDHGGNIAKFPNATIIMQRDELEYALWPDEPYANNFIPGDTAVLRSDVASNVPNRFKMHLLEGDMDIFGDGSVIVKSSRGHTRGHSMMLVRLPKTGSTILTADNVYIRESVEKHIPPNLVLAYDPPGVMRAYAWIRWMAATEGAGFMTSHDPDGFKVRKMAPEYYE